MQNHRLWRICSLVLFTLGVLSCAGSAAAQEYIVDGGFEYVGTHPGQSAWLIPPGSGVRSGAGRLEPSFATTAGTGYAAYLAATSDYKTELVQPLLPLVPGRQYLLSAWVKAEQPGMDITIGVRSQKAYPHIERGLSGEGWERVELEFDAQEGWAQVVLSSTAGVTLWDDVSLQESRTVAERVAAQWERNLKQGKQIYTGLVVNAKGTGLERGMSPTIWDTNGRLVFAGIDASFDQLIRKGIVAYEHTLEEAAAHPRMAVSDEYPMRLPLVVDAQAVSGMPRTSVIIGAEDARRIREATNQYDFLGRFAIVFVVD